MSSLLTGIIMIIQAVVTLSVVTAAPGVSQSVSLVPGRPVIVEIPPNSSVNVTIQQNPPIILSASSGVTLPATVSATTTAIIGTTVLPSVTNQTTSSSTVAPTVIKTDTSARFSNSQSYMPAMMLPLGSEGPNANRETPMNAVPPFGTTLDGSVSPQFIVDDGRQPMISQNRRVEIRLIDFQMNRTGSLAENINQSFTIAVKFIAGSVPILSANEDLAVVQTAELPTAATIFHGNTSDTIHPNTTIVPHSTSGFQEVFNGTYQTLNENKVAVQRIITSELCGQLTQFDRGYLEVSVKPSPDIPSVANFEGYYKCRVNLNYPAAFRESEAYWSDINQCNSGNLTNFSYRLWFKTRQYIIDGATCQRSRPVLDEHN